MSIYIQATQLSNVLGQNKMAFQSASFIVQRLEKVPPCPNFAMMLCRSGERWYHFQALTLKELVGPSRVSEVPLTVVEASCCVPCSSLLTSSSVWSSQLKLRAGRSEVGQKSKSGSGHSKDPFSSAAIAPLSVQGSPQAFSRGPHARFGSRLAVLGRNVISPSLTHKSFSLNQLDGLWHALGLLHDTNWSAVKRGDLMWHLARPVL